MKIAIEDIRSGVEGLSRDRPPVLVGIDGGAGAGKTTLAQRLADGLTDGGSVASVVHVDAFYKSADDRWAGPIDDQPIGHDLDWERLRDRVLLPIRSGQPATYQPFDWPEDRLTDPVTVDPAGVVIAEGVFALRREISDLYDLRIWLTCPQDLRADRIIERGDMTPQELERWMPGEADYIAAHRPGDCAHLVVDGSVNVSDEGCIEAIHWSRP